MFAECSIVKSNDARQIMFNSILPLRSFTENFLFIHELKNLFWTISKESYHLILTFKNNTSTSS